jgi:hypothetical protein
MPFVPPHGSRSLALTWGPGGVDTGTGPKTRPMAGGSVVFLRLTLPGRGKPAERRFLAVETEVIRSFTVDNKVSPEGGVDCLDNQVIMFELQVYIKSCCLNSPAYLFVMS